MWRITGKVARVEFNLNMKEIHSKRVKNTIENNRYFIYSKKFCPRRSLDASKLHRYLLKNNLKPVSNPRKANLIFVYTCGGFNDYEKRSIATIEKSLENKSAKVIVTGCLPKINPKLLDEYRTTYIISPEDLGNLDPLIGADFPYSECGDCSVVKGIHDLYNGSPMDKIKRRLGFIKHYFGLDAEFLHSFANYLYKKILHRENDTFFSIFSNGCYKLEIARGCLGNCSYCAIKLAMPKFNSHPEEQIVEKFKSGLKENYSHFALIAGDIGCYGLDIKTNLPSLLNNLFAVDGDYRILLVDLNARWFIRYYPELLLVLKANSSKVARIIMPIQSGSNRILKLMNRHYEIEKVKNCILDLQKNIPEILLDTHIMVGFPGETDEDFRNSLNLVREIEFSRVEIYPYQDRPGTISSNLPDKVPEDVIKRRIRILKKVARAQ
jgi:tRNA A37 methylthiotransferase MiaB